MNETPSLTDQIANIPVVVVVAIVLAFTLVRWALVKNRGEWARTISEICDTVNFVLVLAFLLIRPFAGQAFYIPSESMESTLLKYDRLVVEKFSGRLRAPHHGEVLVFEAPADATEDHKEGVDFIKRCIGLPHDTIEVRRARVKIDGLETPEEAHDYLRSSLSLGPDHSVKIYSDHVEIDGGERIEVAELARRVGHAGGKIELIPGQTLRDGKVLDEPYTREDPGYDYGPRTLEADQLFMMGDNRNRSHDSHAWGPLERRRVVGHAVLVFWPFSRAGLIR